MKNTNPYALVCSLKEYYQFKLSVLALYNLIYEYLKEHKRFLTCWLTQVDCSIISKTKTKKIWSLSFCPCVNLNTCLQEIRCLLKWPLIAHLIEDIKLRRSRPWRCIFRSTSWKCRRKGEYQTETLLETMDFWWRIRSHKFTPNSFCQRTWFITVCYWFWLSEGT